MAEKRERTFKNSEIPSRGYVHFLEDMKEKKKFCDVTFTIGGESISAHRIIITAVIPYFRNVFSDNNNAFEGIGMPDIEPSAFKCIIDFAYTCELKINEENARELLTAACALGIDEVREECCDFMADCLEHENVFDVQKFATDMNCDELLKSTLRYAAENFLQISQTKDFLNFSSRFLKELLSQDDLNVHDEGKVFEALILWTKASPDDRKAELPELLRNVRLTLLTPTYLATVVERDEIIRSSLSCRDLVEEAKNYILIPELRPEMCSFAIDQRKSMKSVYSKNSNVDCIFKLNVLEVMTVQSFSITDQKWKTQESKSVVQNAGSVVELHGKMYFFHWGKTIEYDPVKNVFKFLRNLPTPRVFAGACSLNDKIYVCGGKVGETPSNAVECFDPKENTWKIVKNMNICREGPSAVCLRGCIFVIGGYDGSSLLNSVERYDSVTNKWIMIPSMLIKRCFAAASSLNGKLYVCGGKSTKTNINASAEVFDPIKNSWEFISSMNSARKGFALLSCNGKLYAIGGSNMELMYLQHTFDIYDPESGNWTVGPSTDPQFLTGGAVAMLCSNLQKP